jgi:phage terminase small subunit
MSLTPMQRQFAIEYAKDQRRNGAGAARRAGFAPGSAKVVASRLLKKQDIKTLIDQPVDHALEAAGIDAQRVIEGIKESIRTAKADGVGAWQVAAIQKGWEMLGKHLGMFATRVDLSATDDVLIAALHAGRRRVAGIVDDHEDDAPPETEEVKKPN